MITLLEPTCQEAGSSNDTPDLGRFVSECLENKDFSDSRFLGLRKLATIAHKTYARRSRFDDWLIDAFYPALFPIRKLTLTNAKYALRHYYEQQRQQERRDKKYRRHKRQIDQRKQEDNKTNELAIEMRDLIERVAAHDARYADILIAISKGQSWGTITNDLHISRRTIDECLRYVREISGIQPDKSED